MMPQITTCSTLPIRSASCTGAVAPAAIETVGRWDEARHLRQTSGDDEPGDSLGEYKLSLQPQGNERHTRGNYTPARGGSDSTQLGQHFPEVS